LDGKVRSRYIALPSATTPNERDKLIAALETRAETPEQFVGGIDFVYDATSDDGIAVYDAVSSHLRVNGLHPFVGAFFDEFTSKTSGLPLETVAMAEVLLESYLHQAGLKQDQINVVMAARDQLGRTCQGPPGVRLGPRSPRGPSCQGLDPNRRCETSKGQGRRGIGSGGKNLHVAAVR
jgi:hypothetical protein